MNTGIDHHMELAYAAFRITVGVNIFLHGYVRIHKRQAFADFLIKEFDQIISRSVVKAFGHTLPLLELTVGLLITIGFATMPALLAGAGLMILLQAGKSLKEDWTTVALQLIYSLCYFLLIAGAALNRYAIDSIIAR